jgi:hypothetical protein
MHPAIIAHIEVAFHFLLRSGDVDDICCFPFHAGEMGRCRAPNFLNPAKNLIARANR